MNLHVQSETARLRAVVLGLPYSPGPTPTLEQTFDSKSYESVLHGVYPVEQDMIREMDAFLAILKKYDVDVYRPAPVNNCNQVFSRDVGFVIDDKIIVSNIIPDRQDEIDAYEDIYRQIHYKNIFNLPETVHVEGGDVVLYGEGLDDDVVSGAIRAIREADAMIIAGTSLTVYPAAGFIRYFKGKDLVVINLGDTAEIPGAFTIRKKVGEVLGQIKIK